MCLVGWTTSLVLAYLFIIMLYICLLWVSHICFLLLYTNSPALTSCPKVGRVHFGYLLYSLLMLILLMRIC